MMRASLSSPLIRGRSMRGSVTVPLARRFTASAATLAAPTSGAAPPVIESLAASLAIDAVPGSPDTFIQSASSLWTPPGSRGIFGGQIIGASVAAAQRTVRGTQVGTAEGAAHAALSLHSLHG
jgi:acyl-CoA thioesterase II